MSDDKRQPLRLEPSSRLSGFYRQTPEQRRSRLVESRWLSPEEAEACADSMVENVIGLHGLPLGLALNFIVNGQEWLVPMAVEEPSIIAAASYAARLCSEHGGFQVTADAPITTAPVQLLDVPSLRQAEAESRAPALLAEANSHLGPMCARGGGARELEVRVLDATTLVVHLHVDTRDAMGANEAGAEGEWVAIVAEQLARERVYRPERAREILDEERHPEGAVQ